jgi:hypothetical protein
LSNSHRLTVFLIVSIGKICAEMVWKRVFTSAVLLSSVAAAPGSNFKALEQCVSGALAAGGNVVKRIQTPANATWEDAFVGAIM